MSKPDLPSGILKLTKLLSHLNKGPKLTLKQGVTRLRVSLAYANDHFGARHFVKEDLPRIRFANPDLSIEVRKFCKVKDEQWSPTIEVVENENTTTVDLHQKHSSTILKELMSVAGGDPWKAHVEHSEKNGLPIVPGEGEYEHILSVSASSSSGSGKAKAGKGQPTGLTKTSKFAFKKEGDKSGLPSLDEWRKKNEKRVEKRDEEIRVRKENKEKRKKEGKGKVGEKEGTEQVEEPVKATS